MQYNIYINQVKALEWSLSEKEALIIDCITKIPTWASGESIEGEIWYYLSAGALVKELPWVSVSKGSFTNWIKKLKDKGLLEHTIHNNKGYYKITNKLKEWSSGVTTQGDKCHQPVRLGVTSQGDNNNTNNNNTNNTSGEEALSIYDSYIRNVAGIDKKYIKKKLSLERIERALKTKTKDEILSIIKTYLRKQRDTIAKGYGKAPQYFFGPVERGSKVLYYEDYEPEEKTVANNNNDEIIF